jgi:hypothetical protein
MRNPSLPLPTYGTKQSDYSSRKSWLNARAKKAGYKNYDHWLTTRRREGVQPQRQGPVELKKGVYKRKKQSRAYRTTKNKQGEKIFYYNVHSWSEVSTKLKSLYKSHKNDVYLLYMNPQIKGITGMNSSPKLLASLKDKPKTSKTPIILTEYNEFTSNSDIQEFIEEAVNRAEEFTETETPFINDFTIVRKTL